MSYLFGSFAAPLSSCCQKLIAKVRVNMPGDSLALAVTTGLGFSVLAGIVSGVCYIITYGLPRKRLNKNKPKTPWHCAICGHQFRSIDGILEADKVVTCSKCLRKACKKKCASRKDIVTEWTCLQCQNESWFTQLLNILQPSNNKGWYSTKKMDTTTIDEIDEDLLELQKKEREQVRDFIERLVGALLGGDLDNVSVKKLYNDKNYDALFSRYHDDLSNALTDLGSALHISIANLPISGQSPCSAHTSLKLLIQRFIQESAELPKLRKFEDHPAIPDDTKDRTYEDLLSTTIINKVIQNYQEPSSSTSSRASTSSRNQGDKEYFFGERNLDSKCYSSKREDDSSSMSSLDDSWKNDAGSTKYFDQMSLTIQQRIEEVSSSSSEDETKDEDEVDSKLSSWSENWYMQKKKLNGANSPVPVPMLVPNPTNDVKVLIGDREADDTTDLSDAGSDLEEEVIEPTTLNAVLVNSKTIIGGRNPLESLISKAESIAEDESTNALELVVEKEETVKQFDSFEKEENAPMVETSNDILIGAKNEDEVSLISLDSNTEKDSEYTERYASLPRTIFKCPKPAPRPSKMTDNIIDDNTSICDNKTENGDSGVTSDEDEKQQKVFQGAYSTREKEKWNHAIELDNNPYSKSNLERRLSNRSSTSSLNSMFVCANMSTGTSIFDVLNKDFQKTRAGKKRQNYYIREASRPAGSRDLEDDDPEVKEIGKQQEDDTNKEISTNEETITKQPIITEETIIIQEPIIIKETIITKHTETKPIEPIIFKAVPARIQEDLSDLDSSLEPSTPTRPNHIEISSDSDYSIERTYNLQTGRILRKHSSQEIIDASRSPEGLKYLMKEFDSVDENDNLTKQKHRFMRSMTLDEDEDEPDSIFITTPSRNHFKLIEEIAAETSSDYNVAPPISPPAEYKTIEQIFTKEEIIQNEPLIDLSEPIVDQDQGYDEQKDFSLAYSDEEPIGDETGAEICELQDKHLVKNLLGNFSKSYPNLNAIGKSNVEVKKNFEVEDDEERIEIEEKDCDLVEDDVPSVKHISKKFDSIKNNKSEQVYSLTARSIPRKFRQELKEEPTKAKSYDDIKEVISCTSPQAEEVALEFPKAKSKIAFFEKLKQ